MLNGRAEGDIAAGRVTVLKLGAGQSAVALLVAFPAPARAARAEPPAITLAASNPAAIDGRARRFPLRFVWQMDAATRFTLGAEDFARLLGPKTGAVLNRPWAEIAAALKLDPQGQVAAALAARDTWSGIVVNWPVDGEAERLPIEMSGLPVFDRERQFAGFRGFGICRDVERMAAIERRRAELPEPPRRAQQGAAVPRAPAPAIGGKGAGAQPRRTQRISGAGARIERSAEEAVRPRGPAAGPTSDDFGAEPFVPTMPAAPLARAPAPAEPPRAARNGDAARDTSEGRPILDRLPVGILVYRLNNLIYANRAFLDWTGYGALDALAEAGGLDSLFIETKSETPNDAQRRQDADHHHRQRQSAAGRRPPVQRRLEQRERAGADDQYAAGGRRQTKQGGRAVAAPDRGGKSRARRHPRHRDRRRAGARPRRPRALRQPQRGSAVRLRRRSIRRVVVRRSVRAGEQALGARLSRADGARERRCSMPGAKRSGA